MLYRTTLVAFVVAHAMAVAPVPAAAGCDPVWRAKCDRLPPPQRARCLDLCPQKGSSGAGSYSGSGNQGKAEIKKKHVPTVKPND